MRSRRGSWRERVRLHLNIDAIRDGDHIELIADEGERDAIARRLDLEGLDRLEAHAALERSGARVSASGRLQASVGRAASSPAIRWSSRIDEPFEILFIAEPTDIQPDDEIELSAKDCDVVFHDGGTIELGHAIADTLALAIDPYPRSAGAETVLKQAGVLSEEEAGPFAALAKLKQRGDGNQA